MNFNRFFVRNYQFTLIIFIAMLILGINSLINMPRSEDPPFGAPIYSIIGIYPGTAPADMEQLVVDPIEEELYKLDDIKEIISTVKDGLVVMLVEFNYGVDAEVKNNDVIREINKLRPSLPEGLIKLDVERAASSDVAILQTAVYSDEASIQELKTVAENLEKDLERIKDVKWVEIQALPEQEVKIEIDLERMATLSLGLNQVLGIIQANNLNIPGGDIDLGQRTYNISTTSEYNDLEEIRNTIIQSTIPGQTTRLRDIAHVYIGYKEFDHIARINGHQTMWVVTAMKDRKNIISARKAIQNVLDNFSEQIPEHIKIVQAFDQEKGVMNRLSGLGRDFAIAIFLVLLTLLPLGPRASFVVMISIPLSLSIGLFLLDLLGYTLNQLSIVGMVIALGLLVDDSIVVVENIERYMRGGMRAKEAAVSATNHIMVAILGCTAALLLAFLPLANMPEAAGEFIKPLPMAVMLTVLASLFVSITIIPFLSSIFLKPPSQENGEGNYFFRAFKTYINTPYQRFLRWCIKHPVITLFGAATIFGLSLFIVPKIGFSLFPASEKPIVVVDIETEPGSNLEHTDRVVKRVENFILSKSPVQRVASNVGKGNPRIYYNEFQQQNAKNTGQLMVFMDDEAHVPEIAQFAEELRHELGNYPGAKIEVRRFQQGTPISAPIEMRLIGTNLDTLEKLGEKVEALMNEVAGAIYVRNDLKYKKSELNISIDKDKAGLYGLTGAEIARTVRLAIAGLDISEFRQTDEDDLNINVSLLQRNADVLQVFNQIHISSPKGALVPLKSVASVEMQLSAPLIRHYNKERYTLISCFVATGYNTDRLTEQIIEQINEDIKMPLGYRLYAAGERESRQESFGGIETIIILTVFGLLAILILEFRTFKSTLIVLSVIPMGVIGALSALWVAGETLSFVATIGMIALAGIEIKNSILLVDYTNGLREKGISLYDAVMDGAETRFLPILLTSLTAIGGMIPLVMERSPLISPLAIVLIGGLISSTLLSRLATPVLYYLIPPKVEVEELV